MKKISLEVESPGWVEFRKTHVTASDAGKLWAGTNLHSVARDKLESTFTGNKYTEWGKQREPIIAQHLSFTEGLTATDDIYIADFNERFSASPDMVSSDLKRLGEIKTVIAKNKWSSVAEIPAHYYGQMQWQMLVAGADEVVLAMEAHNDFEPLPIETLIVRRDKEAMNELVGKADKLLEVLDSWNEDNVLDALIAEFLDSKAKHESARAAVEEYMASNGLESGGNDMATVSYRFTKASKRFDQTAFKTAEPELFEKFMKLSEPTKPTLRITPRKVTNE